MTCVGIERVTEVAEGVAAMMSEEAVRAMPALPVGRVEGVDVDVPSVPVERVAERRRGEAVNTSAAVRQPAEEVADAAVGPVLVDDEVRKRAAPVGEM